MTARSQLSGRRQFYSPLLTETTTSAQSHVCRVCTEEIPAGELVLFRAWHVEYSHLSCKWIRDDEAEPHERTRPGTFQRYWEWRCPECGLDACSTREPDDGSEPRCSRCAPGQHVIALGARVELIVSIYVTHRKRVRVDRGTRAHVREIRTGPTTIARLAWIGVRLPETWLPVDKLVRV